MWVSVRGGVMALKTGGVDFLLTALCVDVGVGVGDCAVVAGVGVIGCISYVRRV